MVKICMTSPLPVSQLPRFIEEVVNNSQFRHMSTLPIGVIRTSTISDTGEPGVVIVFQAEYQNGSPEPDLPDLSRLNNPPESRIVGG